MPDILKKSKEEIVSIARNTLQSYWGYPDFRPPQDEIILNIIKGKSLIGLLPTGAGKSICYQVPGILSGGLTIVVSPLIALMDDQVEQLKSRGLSAVAVHSGLNKARVDAIFDNCIYGDVQFLYLAPERLKTELFQHRVKQMKVSLIAIDEAHCISQWGHDFRPAYKQIGELRIFLPHVPVVAFTATATEKVLNDIALCMNLKGAKIFRASFRKENLYYTVLETQDKWTELGYVMGRMPGAGIVYTRSRKGTEEISQFLNSIGVEADFYHAGLDYKTRDEKQKKWKSSSSLNMVCTNAFGMGIDKPDVRFVVHYEMPGSLEEYYQEAGRAGRDGEKAFAILLADEKDKIDSIRMLELSQPNYDEVKHVYDQLGRFLQIPLEGGVAGKPSDIDLGLFCDYIAWPLGKVKAALNILERNEIIQLNEERIRRSQLQITMERYRIIEFVESKEDFGQFISQLFRMYEGIQRYAVSIDEFKLSRVLQMPINEVIFNLQRLDNERIGRYVQRSDMPQVTFNTIRLPLRNILIDKKALIKLQELKKSQLDAMISYVESETCREVEIINYFSEDNHQPCGKCDICLGSQVKDYSFQELNSVWNILKELLITPVKYSYLLRKWPYVQRKKLIAILGELENERKISIENQWVRVIVE